MAAGKRTHERQCGVRGATERRCGVRAGRRRRAPTVEGAFWSIGRSAHRADAHPRTHATVPARVRTGAHADRRSTWRIRDRRFSPVGSLEATAAVSSAHRGLTRAFDSCRAHDAAEHSERASAWDWRCALCSHSWVRGHSRRIRCETSMQAGRPAPTGCHTSRAQQGRALLAIATAAYLTGGACIGSALPPTAVALHAAVAN